MADLEVRLTRESTGYFNTYGKVQVVVRSSEISSVYQPPIKEWKVLELPWGNFALRLGSHSRSHAPRPFRSLGPFNNAGLRTAKTTSPRALASSLRVEIPPKAAGVTAVEYEQAVTQAFNTGNGAINIHAGNGSWHSFFCPIIGSNEIAVEVPLAPFRHAYPDVPDEPPGTHYRSYGFGIDDSLRAQIEFNLIFARASRILGRNPSVSFSLTSSARPPFGGVLWPPQ